MATEAEACGAEVSCDEAEIDWESRWSNLRAANVSAVSLCRPGDAPSPAPSRNLSTSTDAPSEMSLWPRPSLASTSALLSPTSEAATEHAAAISAAPSASLALAVGPMIDARTLPVRTLVKLVAMQAMCSQATVSERRRAELDHPLNDSSPLSLEPVEGVCATATAMCDGEDDDGVVVLPLLAPGVAPPVALSASDDEAA